MELNRRTGPVIVDGWLTDLGHALGKTLRSTVDITGRAVNVIATRGGADEVVTVTDDAPQGGTSPMVWYALGAAGILAVAAVAVKKRRKK